METQTPKTWSDERFTAQYFRALEQLLAAQARVPGSTHRSDKGEDREGFLVGLLNDHLPQVARAHRGGAILDCEDSLSRQTDVVIYSIWSPLLRQERKPIFFAEGTYAAIEVKSLLTTAALKSALQAATEVKQMRKFRLPLREHGVLTISHTASTICTGLFAYASRIKRPETILRILRDYHTAGVPNHELIDFVCINGKFCFQRIRTEDASAFYSTHEKMTLQEFRDQMRYVVLADSLGPMLDTLLQHISYLGPLQQNLGLYIHRTH